MENTQTDFKKIVKNSKGVTPQTRLELARQSYKDNSMLGKFYSWLKRKSKKEAHKNIMPK